MPESKGKHLTLEDREVIEDGIRDGLGCRAIARRLHVSPSTASREVEASRSMRPSFRKDFRPAQNCVHYRECEEVGTACGGCPTYKTRCRACRSRKCIDSCAKFELRKCPDTERWPWTCPPKCGKSAHCNYPRVRYSAAAADNLAAARLASARSGMAIAPSDALAMMEMRESIHEHLLKEHSIDLAVDGYSGAGAKIGGQGYRGFGCVKGALVIWQHLRCPLPYACRKC